MTLLAWMSTRWRTTPVPERRTAVVVPEERPQPRGPAEYLALYTYLEHRYASTVVLTFEQIEALLGFALPEAAHMERDWWTGAALRMGWHSDAWTMAKRTATPNLAARTVAFERLS
jgi:hypothetical protein